MLALKKKRETEAKAKAAAASTPIENKSTTKSEVSLLGVGGVSTKTKSKAGKLKGKKRTPGEIRLQKDITGLSDFDGGKVATIDFPDSNNLTTFYVYIKPDEGYWRGAKYQFTFSVPDHYPHSPPKVICNTKIYHPNIDLEGNVCLNILKVEWKPVLDINAIILGLMFLFYEPNPDDPLNKDAADLFRNDKRRFDNLVKQSLRGGRIQGEYFSKALI